MRTIREWFAAASGTRRADEGVLALEREVQGLRLQLEERNREVANLRTALARQRGGEASRIRDTAQAQIEQLMADIATPVAQIYTQAHLADLGKPVAATDMVAVIKRLLRPLEDNGLTAEGTIGKIVPFDPDRHELLSVDAVSPGQRVVLRIAGVTYKDKILRKSGVEKAGA